MNLAVLAELEARFPGTDYVLLESGGDNLTLTFSPELVDESLYVIDVAGGDKIPRKRGPGLIRCGLLVINKTDLAPYVGADLVRMDADSAAIRGSAPYLFTDARSGDGIDARHRPFRAGTGVVARGDDGGGDAGHVRSRTPRIRIVMLTSAAEPRVLDARPAPRRPARRVPPAGRRASGGPDPDRRPRMQRPDPGPALPLGGRPPPDIA